MHYRQQPYTVVPYIRIRSRCRHRHQLASATSCARDITFQVHELSNTGIWPGELSELRYRKSTTVDADSSREHDETRKSALDNLRLPLHQQLYHCVYSERFEKDQHKSYD